jgi:hypothetical protein
MEMKIEKGSSVKHALLINGEDILQLEAFFRRNFKDMEYSAQCEDGTGIQFEDLDALLKYENPDFRRFYSIRISASDGKIGGEKVEINLGKVGFFSDVTAAIHLNLDSLDKQILIETELASRIKMMRPWYSPITTLSFTMGLPLILLFITLLFSIYDLIAVFTHWWPRLSTNDSQPSNVIFGSLIFGFLFLVGYIIDRSKAYIFPRVFFQIGRQKNNFKVRQRVAYFVFGVIGLGIIINVISSWFTK